MIENDHALEADAPRPHGDEEGLVPCRVFDEAEAEVVGRRADGAAAAFRIANEEDHCRPMLPRSPVDAAGRGRHALRIAAIEIDALTARRAPLPNVACEICNSEFILAEMSERLRNPVTARVALGVFPIIREPAVGRVGA